MLAIPYLGYPAMLFGGQERGAAVAVVGIVVVAYGTGVLVFDALRARRRRSRAGRMPTVFSALVMLAATAVASAAPPAPAVAATGPAPLERLLVSDDGARFVADGSVALFSRTGRFVPGDSTASTLWVRNASGEPARAGLRLDAVPIRAADRAFAQSLHLRVGDAVLPTGGQWVSDVIAPGETVRVEVALHMDQTADNDARLAEAVVTPVVLLSEALPGATAAAPGYPSTPSDGTLPWTGLRSTPFAGVVVAAAILATLGLALRVRATKRR